MIIAYLLKLETGDWRLYKKGWMSVSRVKTKVPDNIIEVYPILIRDDWNQINSHAQILWQRFKLGDLTLLSKTWRDLWTEFKVWEEMKRPQRQYYTKSGLTEFEKPVREKRANPNGPKPAWVRTEPRKMITITCPHCGKEGGAAVMQRHHFQNCKLKP